MIQKTATKQPAIKAEEFPEDGTEAIQAAVFGLGEFFLSFGNLLQGFRGARSLSIGMKDVSIDPPCGGHVMEKKKNRRERSGDIRSYMCCNGNGG